MRSALLLAVAALVACAACGGKEAAAPAASSAPAEDAGAPAEPTPPKAAEAEPARKPRPLEIHSTCMDVVTVVFSEDPKAPGVGKRTIAPSSSIDGPRDKDGNQTVWLLDAAGEPLVNVKVTRGMKRVEVGRSCRTLDAR
jgi:hypothetical protein